MSNNESTKVLHITSSHRALDNRIFFSEVMSLSAHGFQVAVVGVHPSRNEKLYGIPVIGIRKSDSKGASFLQQPLAVLKAALKHPSEVVHFHDPALIPYALILKVLGRRVVYDVHDDYEATVFDRLSKWPWFLCRMSKLWWAIERLAATIADGVVVADRHLARKFRGMQPTVLGNFPRRHFTSQADTTGEDHFNIIFVGGVSEVRGVPKVLDAIDMLPFEDIRFHIIGDCTDTDLLRRIRNHGQVVYHGRVAWTELHRFYTKAHLGVALYQPLASFMYYPGENSVKIIEYMAAGIPVLCSNFPGLKAFVEDSGYGLTVQPDDPGAIAEKIRFLYENPDVREALGRKGREAFEQEYNWEAHEGKLIALYERILGSGDGR